MSANGDKKIEDRDARRRFQQRKHTVADYASANRDGLIRAICTVTAVGGAIRFGYSRDGNIYAVGILDNGDADTHWATSVEELDELLADLSEHYENLPRLQEQPPRRKK